MNAQPDFGPKPELKWLAVAKLSVDMAYQRSLETRRSQQLVANIAGNFRWSKFGAVLVAPRPLGSFALLDGQHRVAGARQLGIAQVPCIVIEAASKEEQAQAFVGANRDRVAVTPYALHHALVAAGDPRARAIARVCEAADVEIPRYPIPASNLKPNQTLALGTIGKLLGALDHGDQTAHEALVMSALTVLRRRYATTQGAIRAHLVQGLVAFLTLHSTAQIDWVVQVMQPYDLLDLEHRVMQRMQRGAGTRAMAFTALLAEWFKRKQPSLEAAPAAPAREPSKAEVAAARGATLQGTHRVAAPKPFNPKALATPRQVNGAR